VKTFRLIPSFFLCLAFSSPAVACDWELETTVLPPKAEYPKCLVAKDFEQILTTYNTYMDAFLAEDFHTMADQLDYSSKWIKHAHKLDAINSYSFVRTHILNGYSRSQTESATFQSPDERNGYSLWVVRSELNTDGDVMRRGLVWYMFRQVEDQWKISSTINIPPLKSPF